MNLLGFQEALDSAHWVRFGPELVLRVLSLTGLVLTKLIAWEDRKDKNQKDAWDLKTILQHYAEFQDFEISQRAQAALEGQSYDVDALAAWDLGAEVGAICREPTRDCLKAILDRELEQGPMCRLVRDLNLSDYYRENFFQRLQAFKSGLLNVF